MIYSTRIRNKQCWPNIGINEGLLKLSLSCLSCDYLNLSRHLRHWLYINILSNYIGIKELFTPDPSIFITF
ncbi:Hypothetical predicted protein [Octopus vulgaris]|uniref:Uncharacterized protein n=1 Tax=Octopus vulgaris TaxID=6645 RepID=A0AA36FGK9_OCTVU|nr:Hypothetical predicted protein [Octopus vulgaris]